MYHPFGKFDPNRGYMYVDRIGYRIPTGMAEDIGREVHNKQNHHRQQNTVKSRKKRGKHAIQRSLTPHLDCCPETIHILEKKTMWRPIQCFVSLTDNFEPNTGGFEAAPGFHRIFHQWAKGRPKSSRIVKRPYTSGEKDEIKTEVVEDSPPCVGDYTHIRPNLDGDVMKQIIHIPVPAGSAVFWDNRLPHANSYRNDSMVPRAVVYCSFLPDVPINRNYAKKQLEDWELRRIPRSMWINVDNETTETNNQDYTFSDLGRKLIGIDEW